MSEDVSIRARTAVRAVVWSVSIAAGLWVGTGPLHAQSKSKPEKQIDAFTERLDELNERDESGVSEKDRQRARKTLEDAEVLVAEGATERASWLVQQVEDRIELVERLIVVQELRETAEEQQEEYRRYEEKKLPTLRGEIDELQKKKEMFEEKLRALERED